jgi:hypothetical protein
MSLPERGGGVEVSGVCWISPEVELTKGVARYDEMTVFGRGWQRGRGEGRRWWNDMECCVPSARITPESELCDELTSIAINDLDSGVEEECKSDGFIWRRRNPRESGDTLCGGQSEDGSSCELSGWQCQPLL